MLLLTIVASVLGNEAPLKWLVGWCKVCAVRDAANHRVGFRTPVNHPMFPTLGLL